MLASRTSGQPSCSFRHPSCWASSPRSYTFSGTPCHGSWTLAPLSPHLSTRRECMASQIKTPICARQTTAHQFIWQHMCSTLGGPPMEWKVNNVQDFILSSSTPSPTFLELPSQEQSGSSLPPLHYCQMLQLLFAQIGYGLLCGLWVWHRRTNRQLCCPIHRPPHGLHSLTVLHNETIEWLLNTYPEI